MSSHICIRSVDRDSSDFYRLFGPVFGSRQIAKEVGIHAYDDTDKHWIGAFSDGVMIGWLSIRQGVVSDCYVLKECRRNGILSKLLTFATSRFGNRLRATCTAGSVNVFRKAGLVEVRKTVNFTVMRMGDA